MGRFVQCGKSSGICGVRAIPWNRGKSSGISIWGHKIAFQSSVQGSSVVKFHCESNAFHCISASVKFRRISAVKFRCNIVTFHRAFVKSYFVFRKDFVYIWFLLHFHQFLLNFRRVSSCFRQVLLRFQKSFRLHLGWFFFSFSSCIHRILLHFSFSHRRNSASFPSILIEFSSRFIVISSSFMVFS